MHNEVKVGKEELVAWVEKLLKIKKFSFENLKGGDVYLQLFEYICPNVIEKYKIQININPLNEINKKKNWLAIKNVLNFLDIDVNFINYNEIVQNNFIKCYESLIILYFLYSLVKNHECDFILAYSINQELTNFMSSNKPLLCLVKAGSIKSPEQFMENLNDNILNRHNIDNTDKTKKWLQSSLPIHPDNNSNSLISNNNNNSSSNSSNNNNNNNSTVINKNHFDFICDKKLSNKYQPQLFINMFDDYKTKTTHKSKEEFELNLEPINEISKQNSKLNNINNLNNIRNDNTYLIHDQKGQISHTNNINPVGTKLIENDTNRERSHGNFQNNKINGSHSNYNNSFCGDSFCGDSFGGDSFGGDSFGGDSFGGSSFGGSSFGSSDNDNYSSMYNTNRTKKKFNKDVDKNISLKKSLFFKGTDPSGYNKSIDYNNNNIFEKREHFEKKEHFEKREHFEKKEHFEKPKHVRSLSMMNDIGEKKNNNNNNNNNNNGNNNVSRFDTKRGNIDKQNSFNSSNEISYSIKDKKENSSNGSNFTYYCENKNIYNTYERNNTDMYTPPQSNFFKYFNLDINKYNASSDDKNKSCSNNNNENCSNNNNENCS
ncbi:calponin homology domain-containing protein, putative, partial [Hepatocystis sp. ex Piliocolobus tephrosceles]